MVDETESGSEMGLAELYLLWFQRARTWIWPRSYRTYTEAVVRLYVGTMHFSTAAPEIHENWQRVKPYDKSGSIACQTDTARESIS